MSLRGALLLGLTLVVAPLAGAAEAPPQQQVDPILREALIRAIDSSDSFANRYVAEVWLMDMSRRLEKRMRDPQARIHLLRQVHYEASRAKLPPELVLAVIDVESAFNPTAVSHAGARGLMQVMPFWLKEIGRPDDDLFDIETNLRMGCTILRHYLDRARGDVTEALARYNGSYGKFWYPARVYRSMQRRWFVQ